MQSIRYIRYYLMSLLLMVTACASTVRVPSADQTVANSTDVDAVHYAKATRRRKRTPPLEIYDPWEKMNRKIYAFNNMADRYVAKPLAKGYRKVIPRPMRSGIRNFLANLGTPMYALHGILQFDFKYVGTVLSRFVVNSTVGLGGLIDVATRSEITLPHKKDMGQTLGKYKIADGPYLVLPFLGPSTVRNTVGGFTDMWIDPIYYNGLEIGSDDPWFEDTGVRLGMGLLNLVDKRAGMLDNMDGLLENSFDPYAMTRSAYLQYRHRLVYGNTKRKRNNRDKSYVQEK